jgi:hypothetical protein
MRQNPLYVPKYKKLIRQPADITSKTKKTSEITATTDFVLQRHADATSHP